MAEAPTCRDARQRAPSHRTRCSAGKGSARARLRAVSPPPPPLYPRRPRLVLHPRRPLRIRSERILPPRVPPERILPPRVPIPPRALPACRPPTRTPRRSRGRISGVRGMTQRRVPTGAARPIARAPPRRRETPHLTKKENSFLTYGGNGVRHMGERGLPADGRIFSASAPSPSSVPVSPPPLFYLWTSSVLPPLLRRLLREAL